MIFPLFAKEQLSIVLGFQRFWIIELTQLGRWMRSWIQWNSERDQLFCLPH
nr:MAG TPA: hypothetical protein [Caudoviricetes sp.]